MNSESSPGIHLSEVVITDSDVENLPPAHVQLSEQQKSKILANLEAENNQLKNPVHRLIKALKKFAGFKPEA